MRLQTHKGLVHQIVKLRCVVGTMRGSEDGKSSREIGLKEHLDFDCEKWTYFGWLKEQKKFFEESQPPQKRSQQEYGSDFGCWNQKVVQSYLHGSLSPWKKAQIRACETEIRVRDYG